MSTSPNPPRIRVRRVVFLVIVGLLLAELLMIATTARAWIRMTPVYDPPVLAGQMVSCTAGFYARRGDTIVLTIWTTATTARTRRATLPVA